MHIKIAAADPGDSCLPYELEGRAAPFEAGGSRAVPGWLCAAAGTPGIEMTGLSLARAAVVCDTIIKGVQTAALVTEAEGARACDTWPQDRAFA